MEKKILMRGNEAVAEAAVRAGCRLYFGYPITPQNEISEYLSFRLPQVGGVFLQAESEVAAIHMVYGAAATGARVMTSSSGPGISLMQEGLSCIAAAELPCVVVNMSRGGPGVGNIQPAQSDYFQAVKGGGHGDYRLIVLAPSTVQELVDLTYRAFYLADKYRNPVEILGDGMLGQMMEPVVFREPEFPPLPPKDWAVRGKGDGPRKWIVCLDLDPKGLEELNLRLQKKYRKLEEEDVDYATFGNPEPEVLLVGFGTVGRILRSVVREGEKRGLKLALFRPITLFPFPKRALQEWARKARAVLVVEMNLGQMLEDVELAVQGEVPVFFLGHTGGVIPTVEEILEYVCRLLRKGVRV
ncbi:MAG: 3-methyl-2-oxobutanoate dehydrogenase subunit VorB [Candidatus Caldatribacterium sp.]|nr:3-methyl-2-oxobutanoate dehydrogenase subunit VorB [Candidatus Caldatribacterium sp.]